jgi:hypothetical protein
MELEKSGRLYNADLKKKDTGNPDEHKDEKIDLRPEFCDYHDEGCELAESCLNCPFLKCIFEEPAGKLHLLQMRRAQEIARLRTAEGKKIKELADIFGVSKRTVQRALKMAKCHPEATRSATFSKVEAKSNPKGDTKTFEPPWILRSAQDDKTKRFSSRPPIRDTKGSLKHYAPNQVGLPNVKNRRNKK